MTQGPEFGPNFSPIEAGKSFLRNLGIDIDSSKDGGFHTLRVTSREEDPDEREVYGIGFWFMPPIINGIVREALKGIGMIKGKEKKK